MLLVILTSVFSLACSSGGGSDSALNPYGFVISAFNKASVPSLPSNNIRSVIRPLANSPMYVGTDAGVASFDPNQTTLTFTGLTGSPASVNKLVADQSAGDFYVCADNGLFKYDVAAGTFNSDVAFTGKKVLTGLGLKT
jgi:hypothetical protein